MTDPIIDEKRYKFLKYLYDQKRKDTTFILTSYDDLIQKTDLSVEDIDFIEDYLLQAGLVENNMDNALFMTITHEGVKEVESRNSVKKPIPIHEPYDRGIFISHINEDKEIAISLKDLIETRFSGNIPIFVSSDKTSIKYGKEWFPQIKEEIASCQYALILCSPLSINRPWINFESGAAHMIDHFVVPLCYAGLPANELLPPLNQLQGLNVNDHDAIIALFYQIASSFNIEFNDSKISEHSFFTLANNEQIHTPDSVITKIEGPNIVNIGDNISISVEKPIDSKLSVSLFDISHHQDPVAIGRLEDRDHTLMYSFPTSSLKSGEYGLTFETDTGSWNKVIFKII